jgi:predicted MFS family arabinose efflux permease
MSEVYIAPPPVGQTPPKEPGGWGLEWWYNAHFTYGAIQTVFIPIMVPTYVKEMTGSATKVGIAMAIIGCGGLAAPVIGGVADKLRAHRWAQLAGLIAYAAAAIVFAFSGRAFAMHILGAALFGVGSATLLMINPAFIVSGGFEQEDEAKRLTRLNQTVFVGSLIAGLALGELTSLGLSFQVRFLIAAGIAAASVLLTGATNGAAAKRIKVDEPAGDSSDAPKPGIGALLFSNFGLLLLAVFLVTTGHGVITTQYPNYMKEVFTVSEGSASMGLSVAAIVTLLVLGPIGTWMGRSGPSPVWLSAVGLKFAMMVLLTVLAIAGERVEFIPLACYVVFLQGVAMVDMVQPALAARASSAGAGLTQGMLMFAIATAYAVGSVAAGAAADSNLGYPSLAWIVTGVCVLAGLVGWLAFRSSTTDSAK